MKSMWTKLLFVVFRYSVFVQTVSFEKEVTSGGSQAGDIPQSRSLMTYILYYTVLYHDIIYYTILYYTILYYTILYYTITCYYTIAIIHIERLLSDRGVYIYIYIYIHTHIYIYSYLYLSLSIYTYIYIFIYAHVLLCIYIYIYISRLVGGHPEGLS